MWKKVFLTGLFIAGVMGPTFRLTLYRFIPVNPGDAYGVADVFEFYLAGFFLGYCLVSVAIGVTQWCVPRWRNSSAIRWFLGLPAVLVAANVLFWFLPAFAI